MVLKATKFTPHVLLSAPRRSAGAPNATGEKVLYTVSTHSFEEHRKTSQIRVLDIKSGESTLLYEDPAYSEPIWVGEDAFFFLKGGDKGTTSLLLGHASQPGATPTEIHTFDGGLSNLQILHLDDGAVALALSGLANPSGRLYNPDSDENKKKVAPSTGRVYTKLFVRHWDAYVTENKQAIWYGRLEPRAGTTAFASKTYAFASSGLTNLLVGTKLQSPVPPFGGTGDFALGPHGIAFVSRDPAYPEATTTVSNVYFAPLQTYAEPAPLSAPRPIKTGTLRGYSASPVFSPDGRSLAFTRMESPQYESDKQRLLLVPDVEALVAGPAASGSKTDDDDAIEYYSTKDGRGGWDARPESIVWSSDGSELFVTAEHHGRNVLYRLPSHPDEAAAHGLPHIVFGGSESLAGETTTEEGPDASDEGQAVSGFRPLRGLGSIADVRLLTNRGNGDGRLFISSSSLIDSSFYSILDPGKKRTSSSSKKKSSVTFDVVSSQSRHGSTFGLSRQQLGEIWFKGAGDYRVHALVVRPSDFHAEKNKGRTYPLALLIHGGPQSAWGDSWSTRWNPAVFAEQGYVVVAPNPTGSTGYGMALQDGIQNQWGGRPYEDLVNCVDHVAATLPYVDTSRAVALGASYGGYMINWIEGQPLGRRFQALVCHDGVFSTLNQYTSEELFFPLHDFGGTLWENRAGYEKWDPAKHLSEWATPMLVVHNELDYRLPISEGLAMFNVLQSRKIPSRLLSFPDENHWVLKPENSLVWHREVLNWINKFARVSPDGVDDREAELADATAQIKV
ncbi:oligopeptidase family protein [Niveomyces insectorum RCEF 264]|uniref:Dipeptidyl-peptidase V n=1 Tax=Niveomyces insectorum RCEF 264 TaxID=1081102 RepID=A0A167MTZ4_9HYPO|nr:oligopeptidase family protein [Niveomyces insectorum RCEF 264]